MLDWADFFIVPHIFLDYIKDKLPKDKSVIKATANMVPLASLRKGIEKKSKIAVIGSTEKDAHMLANIFISSGLFRPKLVLSVGDIDRMRKELKEVDAYVVCLSAREAVELLKLKDRGIFFFSDYIDDESMQQIRVLSGRV